MYSILAVQEDHQKTFLCLGSKFGWSSWGWDLDRHILLLIWTSDAMVYFTAAHVSFTLTLGAPFAVDLELHT